MKRREFMTLLGTAAAWPLAARAQQGGAMPIVAFLHSGRLGTRRDQITALHRGLNEAGYVEGKNMTIEYRSAEDRVDRLPPIVAELVERQVAVIVANSIAAFAIKAATTTVPIVFASGVDPVSQGLVASFNRPGGNVTGVHFFAGVLGSKRLELVRQVVPKATSIAVLVNPNTTETEAERRDVQAAAQAIGQQLIVLDVSSDRDIEAVFATLVQRGAGALFVGAGPFLASRRERLVALAAQHTIPAIYPLREFAAEGGLMSYGASITNAYREAGIYAARILKGEKPADLPVIQSTKFEFVMNLKTAKMLGLEIPDRVLALADEVIE
jgi:putative tryptophan/tyrosine transport system substrate-binding protein